MGVITARVMGLKKGLEVWDEADFIRIVSSRYNLLIMKDYMPVLGEIRGRVEIVSGDSRRVLEDVEGFYIHKNNQFELLITKENYVD